jgi:C-terminal, D2-small domain, of ClpB protein/AAA domain (Cdc48 subfamily)
LLVPDGNLCPEQHKTSAFRSTVNPSGDEARGESPARADGSMDVTPRGWTPTSNMAVGPGPRAQLAELQPIDACDTVDFKNTLIVLTSNLGSAHLAALADGQSAETVREQVMEEVRRAFRPEFLNRLDEILLFNRLSRAHMTDIVEIQLGRLRKLLADRKIDLELDSKSLQWLANRGYDPVYGARPLKWVIQRSLQNPLATLILEGRVKDGDTVKVTVEGGELSVGGQRVLSEAADD